MGNDTSSEEKIKEEDIGVVLYEKVRNFHEENADKITGMLLEMPSEDLNKLFADDSKLMSKIYEAIKILDYEYEKTRRESLGDVIYPEVEAIYCEHEMAEKITGMLLEMNMEELEKLIEDKNNLVVKIHEAAAVLQRYKNVEHINTSEATQESQPSTEELGEKIFESILQWYPDEETAAKITGMLLEMNNDEIKKLAQEDELLRRKADEADRALKSQR